MIYDPLLLERIPDDVKKAAARLRDLCLTYNLPRDMIYEGVAWDVRAYIEKRAADLLMGNGTR